MENTEGNIFALQAILVVGILSAIICAAKIAVSRLHRTRPRPEDENTERFSE